MMDERITRQMMGSGVTLSESSPDAVIRVFEQRQGGNFFGSTFSGGRSMPVAEKVLASPVDSKVTLFFGDRTQVRDSRVVQYDPQKVQGQGQRFEHSRGGQIVGGPTDGTPVNRGDYQHIKLALAPKAPADVVTTSNFGSNSYSKQHNVDLTVKNPEMRRELQQIRAWMIGERQQRPSLKNFVLTARDNPGQLRTELLDALRSTSGTVTMASANLTDSTLVQALMGEAAKGRAIEVVVNQNRYQSYTFTQKLMSLFGVQPANDVKQIAAANLIASAGPNVKISYSKNQMHANMSVIGDVFFGGDTRYNQNMLNGEAASLTMRVSGDKELNEAARNWIRSKGVVQKALNRDFYRAYGNPLNSILDLVAPSPVEALIFGNKNQRHSIDPGVFRSAIKTAMAQGMDMDLVANRAGMSQAIFKALVNDTRGTWAQASTYETGVLKDFDRSMQTRTFGESNPWLFGLAPQEGARGPLESILINSSRFLDKSMNASLPWYVQEELRGKKGTLEDWTTGLSQGLTAIMVNMLGYTFLTLPAMSIMATLSRSVYAASTGYKGENKLMRTLGRFVERSDRTMKTFAGLMLRDVMTPVADVFGSTAGDITRASAKAFLNSDDTFAGVMYNINAMDSVATRHNPDTAIVDKLQANSRWMKLLSSQGLGSIFNAVNPLNLWNKTKQIGTAFASTLSWATNFKHHINPYIFEHRKEFLAMEAPTAEATWKALVDLEYEGGNTANEELRKLHAEGKYVDVQEHIRNLRATEHGLSYKQANSRAARHAMNRAFAHLFGFKEANKAFYGTSIPGKPMMSGYSRFGWALAGATILTSAVVGMFGRLDRTTYFQQVATEKILNSVDPLGQRQVHIRKQFGWATYPEDWAAGGSNWFTKSIRYGAGTVASAFNLLAQTPFVLYDQISTLFRKQDGLQNKTMAPGAYARALMLSKASDISANISKNDWDLRDPAVRAAYLKATEQENMTDDRAIMNSIILQAGMLDASTHVNSPKEITGSALQFSPISRLMTLTAAVSKMDGKEKFSLTIQGPVALQLGLGVTAPFYYQRPELLPGETSSFMDRFNPANYGYEPGTSGENLTFLAADWIGLSMAMKAPGALINYATGRPNLSTKNPIVAAANWAARIPALPVEAAAGTASLMTRSLISGSMMGALATFGVLTLSTTALELAMNREGLMSSLYTTVPASAMLTAGVTGLAWAKGRDWMVRSMLLDQGSLPNKLSNWALGEELKVTARNGGEAAAVETMFGRESELRRASRFKELTGYDFTKTAADRNITGLKAFVYNQLRKRVYAPTTRMGSVLAKAPVVALGLAGLSSMAVQFYTATEHTGALYYRIREGLNGIPYMGKALSAIFQNKMGFQTKVQQDYSGIMVDEKIAARLNGSKEKGFNFDSVTESFIERFSRHHYLGESNPFVGSGAAGVTFNRDEQGNFTWAATFAQLGLFGFQGSIATTMSQKYNSAQDAYYGYMNLVSSLGLVGKEYSMMRGQRKGAVAGKLFHSRSAAYNMGTAGRAEMYRRSMLSRWALANNMGYDAAVYFNLSRGKVGKGILDSSRNPSAIDQGYIERRQVGFSQVAQSALSVFRSVRDHATQDGDMAEMEYNDLQKFQYDDFLEKFKGSHGFDAYFENSFQANDVMKLMMGMTAAVSIGGLALAAGIKYRNLRKNLSPLESLSALLDKGKVIGSQAIDGRPRHYLMSTVGINPVGGGVFMFDEIEGDAAQAFRGKEGVAKGITHSPKNLFFAVKIGEDLYTYGSQLLTEDPFRGVDPSPIKGEMTLQEILDPRVKRDSQGYYKPLHQKEQLEKAARSIHRRNLMAHDRGLFTSINHLVNSEMTLGSDIEILQSYDKYTSNIQRLEARTAGAVRTSEAFRNNMNVIVAELRYRLSDGDAGLTAEQRVRVERQLLNYEQKALEAAADVEKTIAWQSRLQEKLTATNLNKVTEAVSDLRSVQRELKAELRATRSVTHMLGAEDMGVVNEMLIEEAKQGATARGLKVRAALDTLNAFKDSSESLTTFLKTNMDGADGLIEARGLRTYQGMAHGLFSYKNFVIRADNSLEATVRLIQAQGSMLPRSLQNYLDKRDIQNARRLTEDMLRGRHKTLVSSHLEELVDRIHTAYQDHLAIHSGELNPEAAHSISEAWKQVGEDLGENGEDFSRSMWRHLQSLTVHESGSLMLRGSAATGLLGWAIQGTAKKATSGFVKGLGFLGATALVGQTAGTLSGMAFARNMATNPDHPIGLRREAAEAYYQDSTRVATSLMLMGASQTATTLVYQHFGFRAAWAGRSGGIRGMWAAGRAASTSAAERATLQSAYAAKQLATTGIVATISRYLARGSTITAEGLKTVKPFKPYLAAGAGVAAGTAVAASSTAISWFAVAEMTALGALAGTFIGGPVGTVIGSALGLGLGLGLQAMGRNLAAGLTAAAVTFAVDYGFGVTDKISKWILGSSEKDREQRIARVINSSVNPVARATGRFYQGVNAWLESGKSANQAWWSQQTATYGRPATVYNSGLTGLFATVGDGFRGMMSWFYTNSVANIKALADTQVESISAANDPERWRMPGGTSNGSLAFLAPYFRGTMYDAVIGELQLQENAMRSVDTGILMSRFLSNESVGQPPPMLGETFMTGSNRSNSRPSMDSFFTNLSTPGEATQTQMSRRAFDTQHVLYRLMDRRDDFGNTIDQYEKKHPWSGYMRNQPNAPTVRPLRLAPGMTEGRFTPEQRSAGGAGMGALGTSSGLISLGRAVANWVRGSNGQEVIPSDLRELIAAPSVMTSGFGSRFHPIKRRMIGHHGQDFGAAHGSGIRAALSGTVLFAGVMGGYGNTVEIDHGNGVTTRYAHMSNIGVSVGQKIKQGQLVGALGSTGMSTGPHLHFEVRENGEAINPNSVRGRAIGAPQESHRHEMREHTHQARTHFSFSSSVNNLISMSSSRQNLDPALLATLIMMESRGDVNAVSYVGAQGLTQLMPATAQMLRVNPNNPQQNVEGGARYIGSILKNQNGSVLRAFAGYNGGPGRIDRALANFRETAGYAWTGHYVYQAVKLAESQGRTLSVAEYDHIRAHVTAQVNSQLAKNNRIGTIPPPPAYQGRRVVSVDSREHLGHAPTDNHRIHHAAEASREMQVKVANSNSMRSITVRSSATSVPKWMTDNYIDEHQTAAPVDNYS
jgi:hypothetical protein